ncbi:Ribosome maturation factor RimP [Tepidimonas fonticaldi]|uniref:Ribosome maturation factor RimP n=1 Tax=Tepidimonas fonticaldi TaxID=1101373 RepID=A0A554XQW1_9BURK|nr:ribosome maturation factor RimP [Tepidimonas fonticaldi]TSE38214.1 Ribosome maturation factor RimP [Tepidimonas fonticaldi]
MSWQQVVEQTVVGLGYDLVDLERSAGGLLRVTIDWPWDATQAQERFITVEDCERVTRQLQYVLEVEAVDYRRLEVGSPGIDRPLRHARDYERFVGETVDVTLRAPIGAAGGGAVAPGRRKFRGVLRRGEAPGAWQLDLVEDAPAKPAAKPAAKSSRRPAEPAAVQVLGFTLDEVREARLAPIVDFKGRRPRGAAGNA